MARFAKRLLIGSTETYSGKSATILGIAHELQKQGIDLAYGKPLGNYPSNDIDAVEEDLRLIVQSLGLSRNCVRSPLLYLNKETITKRMQRRDNRDYKADLQQYVQDVSGDLILLEGAGTLWDGTIFDLSIPQIAETTDAAVLLVSRYSSLELVDHLLTAKNLLGDRLLGVMINDIPQEKLELAQTYIKPFLQEQGINVFGLIPRNALLRSVSVRELTKRLEAKVLCRSDRLDLLVQSLSIGAMNVNSALEYFRKGKNMAVITGGDRTDLQLAALETSTHCLILTGHVAPQDFIISRAEDLEVPILSVDLDTLTTVEIVDQTFGRVRLQEPIQVQCVQDLMKKHFDFKKLMEQLGLEPAVSAT